MARAAFFFNGDFEAEIAAWPRACAPGPGAAARNRAFAPCVRPFCGGGDDVVLVPGDEPPGGVERLAWWGAAPSVAALAARLGIAVELPPFDVVKRVNSKVWSHELERALGVALEGACVVRSLAEARAAARACPAARWVLKEPFGVAGQGRLLGRGRGLEGAAARFVERALAREGVLVFEPWVEAPGAEWGIQLEVPREGVPRVVGVTRSLIRGGQYAGSAFGPSLTVAVRIVDLAIRIGRALQREGYFGPAGIDAFDARPLVEVNARRTMGMAALRFAPLVPPGMLGAWLVRPDEPAFVLARDEASLAVVSSVI